MARIKFTSACAGCGVVFSRGFRSSFCSRRCAGHSRRVEPSERFWSKVNRLGESDCWEWTAARDSFGYGKFAINGKMYGSNRVAWQLENGPIPAGLFVCHRCDNPPCCNVRHLFLGTNAEDLADMAAKNRSAIGRRNGQSKLSPAEVVAIRDCGGIQREVAERYGISQTEVSQIRLRKIWAHLA